MDEVRSLLDAHGLASYADAFEKAGWDAARTLAEITEDEAVSIADDCSMKPGHKKRWLAEVRKCTALPSAICFTHAVSSRSTKKYLPANDEGQRKQDRSKRTHPMHFVHHAHSLLPLHPQHPPQHPPLHPQHPHFLPSSTVHLHALLHVPQRRHQRQ